MTKNLLIFISIAIGQLLSAQTGIGTVTPQQSTVLDLMSADKVLLLPRIDNTALVTNPENGMIVYDKTSQCFKVYQNTSWSGCLYRSPGAIGSINCNGTPDSGSLKEGIASTGVHSVIAYTGGNGATHKGQSIASTGVTGLTATLNASNFVTGDGTLLYTITGTPIGYGTASFALNIGGQTCILTRKVWPAVGAVTSLTCGSATSTGTLIRSVNAAAVTAQLPYSGGNGGDYIAQTTNSTGVTGLTATLVAGTFQPGTGNVTLNITGTPSNDGVASFAITLGGQSCTLTLPVLPGSITGLDCAGSAQSGTLQQGIAATGASFTISYSGSNAGGYSSQILTSTGVTGLTATLAQGIFASGSGQLTYSITGTAAYAGTATFNLTIGGQSCAINVTVAIQPLNMPSSITLGQNQKYLRSSIYDNDYLPFTAPLTAATTTSLAANGSADPLINVQGSITTSGNIVSIPTLPGGSGTLPAFTSALVNIPASLTEDNTSRNIVLSWISQAYTTDTRAIKATIKTVDGTLNIKKLDINSGLGNDALGILLGTISYPYNSSNAMASFEVRGVSGIPDKMFGIADNTGSTTSHRLIYAPAWGEDGKIWLNNNLGADYSNYDKTAVFNPGKQASSDTDYNAFGSRLQWGRKTDGHELMNWTSPTAGSPVNGITATLNNAPTHALFIKTSASPNDWRINKDDTLWANVNSANNPCPIGFKLPSTTDLINYSSSAGIGIGTIGNINTDPNLKFSVGGFRNVEGNLVLMDRSMYYTNTINSSSITTLSYMSGSFFDTFVGDRVIGNPVRCIKN